MCSCYGTGTGFKSFNSSLRRDESYCSEREIWTDGLPTSACRCSFITNFAPGLVAIMREKNRGESAVQKLEMTFPSH